MILPRPPSSSTTRLAWSPLTNSRRTPKAVASSGNLTESSACSAGSSLKVATSQDLGFALVDRVIRDDTRDVKIHEYQGKQLFQKYGVPVPRGIEHQVSQ